MITQKISEVVASDAVGFAFACAFAIPCMRRPINPLPLLAGRYRRGVFGT